MNLPDLHAGRLLARLNRFVVEVDLDDGRRVLAHCPNTGSMLGCRDPGSRVWLSPATNPERKLQWTWELVESAGALVGIHTGRSNSLVREAIVAGRVPQLAGYERIRPEVRYGTNSRIDLLLEGSDRPCCWVEVKNVTAAVDNGTAYFPDAVTTRGTKHLREMQERTKAGDRAAIVFCVQRRDVREVRPADHIDPIYGSALREALAAGVEAIALGAEVTPQRIELLRQLPVVCP